MGQTEFRMAHKCNGQRRSQWTRYSFCGYQTFQVDRISEDIRALRRQIARENRWTEERNRAQIDALMAQQTNTYIADPKANIREETGIVSITILNDESGTACIGPRTIRYEPRCAR